MLLPPGSQNPWGSPPGGGSAGNAFLSSNRPVIADLALAALKERGEVQKKRICPQFRTDRSLCLMTKKNPIRRFCICIVDAKPFDYFILATILCNCLALAFNHPYPGEDSNTVNMVLEKVELAFVIIFTTESALKIIAYGFVLHPGAYLRTFWNVLDFSIVLIGLSSKALENMNVDVKALRAFRVLRPLRLLSGLPSLQIVLNSIITAMVPLLHIALLVIFVIIVYAIVGLELFQSKLHFTCYRNTSLAPLSCTLRVINTQTDEGLKISDAIGSWWPWIYFVTLILLGSFFVMNLVLGVLSGEFSKEKEKIDRTLLFRKERQEKREQQDYLGYKEWIELAEELSDSEGEDKTSEDVESGAGGEMVETVPEMHVDEVVKTQCHSTLRRLRKFRKRTRRAVIAFINSRQCFALIIILVFLNTVVLTTEHHNQPKWLDEFQDFANDVFVTLFTLEMLIKIAASGLADYFSKLFNRFDFFIVIFSIMELLLVKFGVLNPMGVSVLRCARLLRIFKLTQYWESLRNLVGKLLKSVKSVASLLLLLSIFILICSLLGMQLFGGRFNFITQEKPRANFDGILQAMLTVFQILTGEDWNEVMYNGMRAYENSHWYAVVVVYFIFLFIVGNYILLNVFLAIAVDNLNDEDDDEEEGNGAENNKEQTDQTEVANGKEEDANAKENELTKNENENCSTVETKLVTEVFLDRRRFSPTVKLFKHFNSPHHYICICSVISVSQTGLLQHQKRDLGVGLSWDVDKSLLRHTSTICISIRFMRKYKSAESHVTDIDVIVLEKFTPYPHHFWAMVFHHALFRIFCHNVVCLSHFGNIVLVCILVSSILLAAEDPLNAGSQRNKILNTFDYFFTSVFTVEITLKMISYGFVLHEGSFCRSAFNLLDLIVVCVALISFVLQNQTISAVKILRVLRVLRPLRAINRAKGLKVRESPNLRFMSVFIFPNGYFGVQSKQFVEPNRLSFYTFFNFFTQHVVQCMVIAIRSIGNIVLVTFLLQFMFGVIGVQLFKGKFYKCTDVSKHTEAECKGQYIEYEDMSLDKPSLRERHWVNNDFNFDDVPHALLTLFTVSTFEGWPEMCGHYNPRFNCLPHLLMYNSFTFQRKCIEYALKARPRRRYIPKGHLQYKIWSVVVSKKFEIFIFICIFINTVALMLKYDRQDESEAKILDSFNYFFTAIFTVEFVLRLSAFSFRHYFGDIWNVIDFVLVLGSYIDIIVTQSDISKVKFSVNFFRLFRVMRLVKLLSKEESIRQLLWTFIKSIQSSPLYIAFRNICATGESWQEIMLKCTAGQKCSKDSDDRETNECGSKLAYPYFISFHAISAFLVINLFVAVIMDNFDYLTRDWSILGPHHLDEFVTKWADYDPEAKGRVRHLDVVTMLGKISPPLGFGSMCPHTRACHKLVRMNMPLNSDGTVFFNATLFALVRRNLKIKIPGEDKDKDKSLDQLNEELRIVIKRIWKRTSPRLLDQIIPPKESMETPESTNVVFAWKINALVKNLAQSELRAPKSQSYAGDRAMPHQPTIIGFPRRCSSDLTGEEIQRRRGAERRETSGGIFGRTLTEWTRRRSSKRTPDRRVLMGGGIRGPIMDEHGITIDYSNGGGAGLMNNFGVNAQAGQTAHPAVMALLEKEKKEAEAARPFAPLAQIASKRVTVGALSSAPKNSLYSRRCRTNLRPTHPTHSVKSNRRYGNSVARRMVSMRDGSHVLFPALSTKAVYELTTNNGDVPVFSSHELVRMLNAGRSTLTANQLQVPKENPSADSDSPQSGNFLGTASSVLGFLRRGSFRGSSSNVPSRDGRNTMDEDLDMARRMFAAARRESVRSNMNMNLLVFDVRSTQTPTCETTLLRRYTEEELKHRMEDISIFFFLSYG
ncbi:Voltage-dependent L-type calcium channel subunit alpha [Fasciola gigantica]|uniref:Voltage-dependent L-type calcium channel subunit alpha n=1 Tax=Fasciola gigantica TaxID=46835 RepID=A0A504WV54_FASGI|nr:Voltage-dependent L-type calcium channel subunit alpha [Fasciola gigantica]